MRANPSARMKIRKPQTKNVRREICNFVPRGRPDRLPQQENSGLMPSRCSVSGVFGRMSCTNDPIREVTVLSPFVSAPLLKGAKTGPLSPCICGTQAAG
eukprot:3094332-Rhodomonas_salina.1